MELVKETHIPKELKGKDLSDFIAKNKEKLIKAKKKGIVLKHNSDED